MRVWWTKSVALLGTCSMILQFLQGSVLAGPVKRSSRMIREVYPEIEPEKLEGNQAEVCIVGDVVYGADEPVPADQPCLKCKCQPPGVQCETTRCVKKPGCRAIHKPNQCCPEYQCECEYEGRFYANGERLETPPGGECRVCYCRGGEVQCAEVSCYIRTDCEGRTVPGQCCPKYDHCPPREPVLGRVVPYTTQPVLTSNADNLDLSPSNNASVEEDRLTTAVYDLHEITNEESNKITDTQTEFLTKPSAIQTLNNTKQESNKIHIQETIINIESQPNPTNEIGSNSSQEQEEKRNSDNAFPDAPKITIQEIIPEIKEIPITGPPKREINLHSYGLNFDDLEYTKREKLDKATPTWYQDKENNVSDLALGDAETDSSEISEIYHHPPPVLKIGDQLLFLKKGELVPGKDISTPVPVITIIGAEGLQRGTEDSVEFHEIPSQVQEPHNDDTVSENPEQPETTTEIIRNENIHIQSLVKSKSRTEYSTQSSLSTIENFLLNLTKAEPTNTNEFSSESIDANTSMLTETLINKIKSLTNAESTTDVAHLVQKVYIADVNNSEFEYGVENSSTVDPNINIATTTDEKWYEVKTSEEQHSSTSAEPAVTLLERIESLLPTSTESIENEDNKTQSSNHSESRFEDLGETKLKHEDDGIPIEQNPEYPPIPDIMSPQNADDLSEHLDAELAQVTSEEPLVVADNTSTVIDTSLNTTTDAPADDPKEMRILPDVLTENNKSIENITTPPELLKNTTNKPSHPLINQKAALPTSILKQIASSDHQDENTTKSQSAEVKLDGKKPENQISGQSTSSTESTPTSNADRSKETVEASSEESGESTTPQNKHASILLSTEDASVETTHSASTELDLTDLVETISGIQESTEETENRSEEKKDKIHKKTVLVKKDVEIIDPQMLLNKTKEDNTIKNISYENNKRKNQVNEDEDSVFKELNEELKSVPSHVIDNKTGNDDADAEAIFRELLEEATSSTFPPNKDEQSGFPQARDKESQLLQRVSDAITKFQVKESKESLDTSILGILRDFFSSQYKPYAEKK